MVPRRTPRRGYVECLRLFAVTIFFKDSSPGEPGQVSPLQLHGPWALCLTCVESSMRQSEVIMMLLSLEWSPDIPKRIVSSMSVSGDHILSWTSCPHGWRLGRAWVFSFLLFVFSMFCLSFSMVPWAVCQTCLESCCTPVWWP